MCKGSLIPYTKINYILSKMIHVRKGREGRKIRRRERKKRRKKKRKKRRERRGGGGKGEQRRKKK